MTDSWPKNNKTLIGVVCAASTLLLVLLVVVAELVYLFLIKADAADLKPWTNYRLSNTTVPVHYNLTIGPSDHINFETFSGVIIIDLSIKERADYIYLHSRELNITESKVVQNSKQISITNSFYELENEYWVMELGQWLHQGNASLELHFEGSLTNHIYGFYRSSYKNGNNQTRYLATTKFEPTYARMAFPCFDEPNKKAVFTIKLVHSDEYPVALSNMPAKNSIKTEEDGWTTEFETTKVPMSTYLVAFVVCDFQSLSNTTKGNVEIRTFAPPEMVNDTQRALDIAIVTLDHFDEYFNMSYNESFPKLDMIGIPDFQSGAMENWGLITYRMPYLVSHPNTSSTDRYVYVAEVVCHELAHMWFGNVVTMDWWDDLWLNEGFATFMSYVGMHVYSKEWDVETEFLVRESYGSMRDDSWLSTHPVRQPVDHPDQISNAFNSVTYGKGASILRLLEYVIGKTAFQKGVQLYLKRFKYKNARTEDLWTAMSDVSNQDVNTLMKFWTNQAGYPVVQMNEAQSDVTQMRLLPAYDSQTQTDSTKWPIPLTKTSGGDLVTLPSDKQSMLWNHSLSFTSINSGQHGFYRVLYSHEQYQTLTKQLIKNITFLSTADRSSLLEHTFQLAYFGHVSYSNVMDLLESVMPREHTAVPWQIITNQVHAIHRLLTAHHNFTSTTQLFDKFIVEMQHSANVTLMNILKDNTSYAYRRIIPCLAKLACYHNESNCTKWASNQFNQWLANSSHPIPADYSTMIARTAVNHESTQIIWPQLMERFMDKDEQNSFASRTMVAVNDHAKLKEMLNKVRENPQHFKKAVYMQLLKLLAVQSAVGLDVVMEHFDENWPELEKLFGATNRYFGAMQKDVWGKISTKDHFEKLKSFFARHPVPEDGVAQKYRTTATQQIKQNIYWTTKSLPVLEKWLKDWELAQMDQKL